MSGYFYRAIQGIKRMAGRPEPDEPPPPEPSGGGQGSAPIQHDESVHPQPPTPPIEPVDRGDENVS
jgi:hypothetical protein